LPSPIDSGIQQRGRYRVAKTAENLPIARIRPGQLLYPDSRIMFSIYFCKLLAPLGRVCGQPRHGRRPHSLGFARSQSTPPLRGGQPMRSAVGWRPPCKKMKSSSSPLDLPSLALRAFSASAFDPDRGPPRKELAWQIRYLTVENQLLGSGSPSRVTLSPREGDRLVRSASKPDLRSTNCGRSFLPAGGLGFAKIAEYSQSELAEPKREQEGRGYRPNGGCVASGRGGLR
jgi:hypothetical protein